MLDFRNWKKVKTLDECDEKDIKELLFGRKVEKVLDDTLMLDNGVVLEILPNEGCGGCNAGWYEIEELNGCDNAITNVEFIGEQKGDEEYSYQIFVFTMDKRIKLLQVDGDDGNGYYGTGYRINVKVKE